MLYSSHITYITPKEQLSLELADTNISTPNSLWQWAYKLPIGRGVLDAFEGAGADKIVSGFPFSPAE
jgi:hypothetical protein